MKLIYVLLAMSLSSTLAAKEWSEVYSSSKNSIALVNQAGAICSGFLWKPTETITAAHCVQGLRKTYVAYKSKRYPSQVIDIDTENDLALLIHDSVSDVSPMQIRKEDSPISVGEGVASIGHPTIPKFFAPTSYEPDYTYLLSSGIVSGETEGGLISDLSLSPGNSGGPILDQNQNVLGVVSRKRVDQNVGNIGIATNAKKVREFAKKNRSLYKSMTWRNTPHRPFLHLGGSSYNVQDDPDSHSNFTMMLGFSFWQRLDLGFLLPIGKVPEAIKGFGGAQLSIPLEFTFENNSVMTIKPTVGGGRTNKDSYTMAGVKLQHSLIPLYLSYESYTPKEKKEDHKKFSIFHIFLGSSF